MSYDSFLFFLNYSSPFSQAAMPSNHPNLFSPNANLIINKHGDQYDVHVFIIRIHEGIFSCLFGI